MGSPGSFGSALILTDITRWVEEDEKQQAAFITARPPPPPPSPLGRPRKLPVVEAGTRENASDPSNGGRGRGRGRGRSLPRGTKPMDRRYPQSQRRSCLKKTQTCMLEEAATMLAGSTKLREFALNMIFGRALRTPNTCGKINEII